MRVDIISSQIDYQYKSLFTMRRLRLQHERFDGQMSGEMERVVFERVDAVGVLLYDAAADAVVLIKQFRLPAYLHDGSGWLIEIVAGVLDKGRDAMTVAHSELVEEIGYHVAELTRLGTCYLSPGGSTEQIHLYLGDLQQAQRVNVGGGLASEHEDIQFIRLPLTDALTMIERGEICDAKTIIALQQLVLRRPLTATCRKI